MIYASVPFIFFCVALDFLVLFFFWVLSNPISRRDPSPAHNEEGKKEGGKGSFEVMEKDGGFFPSFAYLTRKSRPQKKTKIFAKRAEGEKEENAHL